ncbi:unnamed protein product [Lampetra planeri]
MSKKSGLEVAAPPADLDDRVQEGEPDDAETPSPAQEWRAIMGQWEAKLAMLTEAFDRFMVTERESPTVSGQSPHAPAPPVVADDAATTLATLRTEPDAADVPGSPPPGSRRQLHVERFEAKVGDWTTFTWRFRAAYESLDWAESDALRALPTALDDDALAAFYGIPAKICSSLAGAFAAMQDIYEPRNSDDDMSSLQIARNIQTNLDLRDEPTAVVAQPLVVCAGAARCPAELEELGPLAAAAGLPLASLPHRPEMYGAADVLRVRAVRTLRPGLLAMQKHLSKGAG